MESHNQEYILSELRRNRDRGAELLLEAYTPLLWSVCQRRLSDPEDIKECINDVFAQFCADPEQYDPAQSSLKNYLAMLADRKAISRYRHNRKQQEAEAAATPEEPTDRMQLHRELEEALESLPREDAQILRMKYYGGLTYGEIAQQLDITEDAAKKRGARSLKKLAKWMIIGLVIAALLAGCAYVVHRYLRYAKGIGLVENQETAVYQMVQAPEPLVGNGVSVEIMNVSWAEGRISVAAAFLSAGEDMQESARRQVADLYDLYINGIPVPLATGSNPVHFYEGPLPEEVLTAGETVKLELILNEDRASRLKHRWREVEPSTLTWEIPLEPVEALESLTDLGCYLATEKSDFLIMTDRETVTQIDASFALVSLYPMYKEENTVLSDLITYSYPVSSDYVPPEITLVAEDGTVYPMSRVTRGNVSNPDAEFILWFQDAPPGTYTLRIPQLCYRIAGQSKPLTLPLPREDGVFLPCAEEVTFDDGTVLRYTGVTRQTTHQQTFFMVKTLVDGQENWEPLTDDSTSWNYSMEYQVEMKEDFPFFTALADINFFQEADGALREIPKGDQIMSSFYDLGHFTLLARDLLEVAPADQLTILFGDFFCIDPQEYAIAVTVE